MTAGSLFHFHMQHHQLKSYHTYEKKRQNTKEEEYAKCTISECILSFSFNWVQHTDTWTQRASGTSRPFRSSWVLLWCCTATLQWPLQQRSHPVIEDRPESWLMFAVVTEIFPSFENIRLLTASRSYSSAAPEQKRSGGFPACKPGVDRFYAVGIYQDTYSRTHPRFQVLCWQFPVVSYERSFDKIMFFF